MSFIKDENGQGMVEYALILGLIAVAAIAVIVLIGPKISGLFSDANDALDEATTSA
ncbi:MAG: Flp family type IVb pilin [Eubacterium sp.]